MKVAGVSAPTSAEAASSPSSVRRVDPQRTPVSKADLRGAIDRAWQRATGQKPTSALLDTLTAQASLETASGAQMFNYNFGGIKGASPEGMTALTRTHEVMNGKDVVIKDGFRAYSSLDAGAADYVHVMRSRFGAALEPASHGDTAGFAHALKQAGYYTASEKTYADALLNLAGSTAGPFPTSTAMKTYATADHVARMSDVASAGDWQSLPVLGSSRASRANEEDSED